MVGKKKERWRLSILPHCHANLTKLMGYKEGHIFAIFISKPRSLSVLDLKMLELLCTFYELCKVTQIMGKCTEDWPGKWQLRAEPS